MSNIKIGVKSQKDWNNKWKTIFDHYQNDLRHAYYINAFLNNNEKVLEIAAGSFRDVVQLNKFGVNTYGTDFSSTAADLAKEMYPKLKNKFFQSDAFNMGEIKDNYYTTTFHNGFWVLFQDDSEIIKLAKEQARITSDKMIVTVHNGHNKDFIKYFKKLSLNDELYKIRFFKTEEIKKLMLTVCKSVKIIPVGKGKKFYEDKLINEGFGQREMLNTFFNKTGNDNLLNSERLLCIGEI